MIPLAAIKRAAEGAQVEQGTDTWVAHVGARYPGPATKAYLALFCDPATLLALVTAVEAAQAHVGHFEGCAIGEWEFHMPYSRKKPKPACSCALAPFTHATPPGTRP